MYILFSIRRKRCISLVLFPEVRRAVKVPGTHIKVGLGSAADWTSCAAGHPAGQGAQRRRQPPPLQRPGQPCSLQQINFSSSLTPVIGKNVE